MAENNESDVANKLGAEVEQLKKQLDLLDRRLDNIDSVISAVAERVMSQPITFNVTCSQCGHKMEISMIGTERPSR